MAAAASSRAVRSPLTMASMTSGPPDVRLAHRERMAARGGVRIEGRGRSRPFLAREALLTGGQADPCVEAGRLGDLGADACRLLRSLGVVQSASRDR